MKKRILVFAVFLCLLTLIPFGFTNPGKAGTSMVLKKTRISLTAIQIEEDNLVTGTYKILLGARFQRIFGTYGNDFNADNQYSLYLGDIWSSTYMEMVYFKSSSFWLPYNDETKYSDSNCYIDCSYVPDMSVSGFQWSIQIEVIRDNFWQSWEWHLFSSDPLVYGTTYSRSCEFQDVHGGDITVWFKIDNI